MWTMAARRKSGAEVKQADPPEAIPRIGPEPEPRPSASDYAKRFESDARAELESLTGEPPGAIVGAILEVAAMQLGAARALFDAGSLDGDKAMLAGASTIANGARYNLVSAHALHLRKKPPPEEGEEFYMPGGK